MANKELQKKWKRGGAIVLTAAMIANTALPGAAYASEFTAPEGEVTEFSAESTEEAAQVEDSTETFSAGDSASASTEQATALQERINALPTVEEFKAMADGTTVEGSTLSQKQYDAYMEAENIVEAYEKLPEEEKQLVDTTKMEALFEHFNEQIDSTSDNVVVHAAKNGQNSIRVDYTVNAWSSWSYQEDIGWRKWVLLDKNIGTDADVIAQDYLERHGAVSSGEKMVEKFLKNDGISICKRFTDDYKRTDLGSSSYDILDVSSLGAYDSGKYYIYMLAMLGKNACNYPYAFAGTIKTGNGKILFRADGNDTATTGWTVLNGYEMNLNSSNLKGATASVSPEVIVPDSGQTATVTITPGDKKRFVTAPTVSRGNGTLVNLTLNEKTGVYTGTISGITGNETITVSGTAIAHTHEWKYRTVDDENNKNKLEVYCANDNVTKVFCDHNGTDAARTILTLTADSLPYTGKPYAGAHITYDSAVSGYVQETELGDSAIEYYSGDTKLKEAPTKVGVYTAKITLGKGENAATAEKEFKITEKVVDVPTLASKTYTGENQIADLEIPNGENGKPLYSVKENNGGTDVGTYNVTLTLKDDFNYKWNNRSGEKDATTTFEITKKPVTITAQDVEKTYGEAEPSLESAWKVEEDLGKGTPITGIQVSREAGEDAGTYTITASQPEGANPNYAITFNPGTFTINKKALTITPKSGQSKIYGDADPVFTYDVEGLVNGEKAEDVLKGVLGRTDGSAVGSYVFTLGTLNSQENAPKNYTLSLASEIPEFTIEQKELTDDMLLVNVKGKDDVEVIVSDSADITENDYTITKDLTSDPYVITIEGKGNYKGTVVRKITAVKTPEKADDNTTSTAVIEGSKENELKTSMTPVKKDDAKELLDANLTGQNVQDVKDIINGKTENSSYDATVYLKREEKTANDSKDERAKIEAAIKAGKELPYNAQIAETPCLNLQLLMSYVAKVNNQIAYTGTVQIADAGKNVQSVTVTIPESLRKISANTVRDYYVVRVSGDEVKKVNSSVNGNQLTFTFDKSAVYAIVYKDTYYAPSYPVTGITASTDKITLTEKDATADITVKVTPSYADNKNVTWKSGDEKIATVDKNGKVTAVGNGTTTITATTVDGNYTATVTVTVNIPEEKPEIDKVTLAAGKETLTKIGETTQIDVKLEPANAKDQKLTWKSSDESVATVDENGKVTAVGNGTATITVTTEDGKHTATTTITVKAEEKPDEKPAEIEKITVSAEQKTLTKIGESTQLDVKIEPANAKEQKLTWKSGNEKVAVVDANGKVTAVGTGTTTITVNTEDGKHTATITITVKVPDEPAVTKTTGFGRLKARSVTQTNNSIKLDWTRVSDADGYIVYGNLCNANGKTYKYQKLATITNNKTKTWTHTKLKKGTYYKYIVKAYKVVNGKKVITDTSVSIHTTTKGGKYGVAKSVSVTKIGTKKNTLEVTLKKGKTAQITAKEVKMDKKIRQHRGLCYESSNKKVATVTPDGVITAVGKGTCSVWVYAQNGVYKTITVTVK